MTSKDRKWLAKLLFEIGSNLSIQSLPRDVVFNTLNQLEGCLIIVKELPSELLQIAINSSSYIDLLMSAQVVETHR